MDDCRTSYVLVIRVSDILGARYVWVDIASDTRQRGRSPSAGFPRHLSGQEDVVRTFRSLTPLTADGSTNSGICEGICGTCGSHPFTYCLLSNSTDLVLEEEEESSCGKKEKSFLSTVGGQSGRLFSVMRASASS